MSDVRGRYARSVPYESDLKRRLEDPEFRRAYEELEPEFQITRQIVALRNERKMTQTELAKRTGTTQSSIARLESKGRVGTLRLLQRVADALDAQLEVRLVPRAASHTKGGERTRRSAPGHRAGPRSLRAS
ncbi:MAG: helix-turn-helix transcriptional regulator [Chloroflexi bacterium]|nr:helix-turn-helix transcriptional regulator [Chloroflexota bacterium]